MVEQHGQINGTRHTPVSFGRTTAAETPDDTKRREASARSIVIDEAVARFDRDLEMRGVRAHIPGAGTLILTALTQRGLVSRHDLQQSLDAIAKREITREVK